MRTPARSGRLLLVAGTGLALAATAFALEPGRDAIGVTAHRLWIYAHLLLFVFWLGADLGVFLCSRALVQPGLTPEQRLRTAGLMDAIDLAPRVSASLMLTVGGILTEYVGIGHPAWQMAGILLLGPVWLALVLAGHLRDGTPFGDTVARLDVAFRAVLVLAVPVSVAWSWSTGRLEDAPWVAGKLLIFAAVMLLGLVLRWRLRPFTAGLRELGRGRAAPGIEAAMRASHAGTRGLVVAIWIALCLAALLGIAQPGDTRAPATAIASAALSLPAPPPQP
jgi:hypothetical protein